MELKIDRTLKLKFSETDLAYFWLYIENEFINCFQSVLLQFSYHLPRPTYANWGFQLSLRLNQEKENAGRTIDQEMRATLSTIVLNFDRLFSVKQAHISH